MANTTKIDYSVFNKANQVKTQPEPIKTETFKQLRQEVLALKEKISNAIALAMAEKANENHANMLRFELVNNINSSLFEASRCLHLLWATNVENKSKNSVCNCKGTFHDEACALRVKF